MSFSIIFICNEYPPAPYGGIGIFVKTLGEELVKRGVQVYVLGYNTTLPADQIVEQNGVKVYWLSKRTFMFKNKILQELYQRYCLTKRMRLLEKEVQPSIIESFDWSGPLLWKPKKAILVVRMHGAHSAHAFNEGKRMSRFLFFLERLQLRLADALCAVSKHMGETTTTSLRVNKPFAVIYNPVDCNKFFPIASVEKDPNVLLYVGRLHQRKGLGELIMAFNKVADRNKDIKLQIAGPENEQYRQHLLSLVTLNAKERIFFLGRVPHQELCAVYNAASVTIFPSRAEAFGITIVESMACAIAPIVTNRASGPEIIDDGETGWLVDITDAQAITEIILKAFNNSEQTIGMGLKAREQAMQRFSLEKVLDSNLAFYKSYILK